jgi:hypothetical protein
MDSGGDAGDDPDYDPSSDVAVPANTDAQRLGMSNQPTGPTQGRKPNKPKRPKKPKNRNFPDCAAAANAVGTLLNETASSCKGSLTPISVVKNNDGTFTASVTATFTAKSSKPNIAPISWPNMTAADNAAVAAYDAALMQHELGHAEIAQNVCTSEGGTLNANGSTEAAADQALQEAINEKQINAQSKLTDTEDQYDSVTDHGRNQSDGPNFSYEDGKFQFPGGNDVILDCP